MSKEKFRRAAFWNSRAIARAHIGAEGAIHVET